MIVKLFKDSFWFKSKVKINKHKIKQSEIMNKNKINNILKITTSIIIIVTLFIMVKQTINNTQEITEITKSAGIFGPIVLIVLIMLGILFSPIPSVVIIIAAGYIYGPIYGAIYSYIGHLIGANGIYFAVKKFKILNNIEKFEKYKQFVEKNKNILYLFYTIPIIPVTITSIIAATSEIKFKKFIEVTLISFLPAVILFSFLGGKISNENMIGLAIVAIIVIILILIIIKKYKAKLEEVEKKLEKNIKKVKSK